MIKQHDWFAASLFQPEFSTEDFYDIGITPENAEIKSQDVYKNIPEVIEAFSKDGKFDEASFNTFYNNALSSYNKFSKSEFDKKILENYEWDPNDWMAPVGANTRDVSAKFILGKNNPSKIQSGIEALGIRTESSFSNRELAQANEVRDANGNKLGYTPNDKAGLFKSLNMPTLVLAQYDEDTEEIIDGRKVIHKKGELKLDEYGVPYYEELGDREIYGRDVLHHADVLTVDGSKWNKYDFFDSDGLDKSIAGTVAKTAFKIAPYFIPYVNYAWGAVNAATEISQLLPVLGKAVNGFFTNNEDTKFNKALSKWEGYVERFESSTSDYSRDKMVTFENFGNLVGDISGQLWQQRVIGSIPQLLEKTKLLEAGSKNIKLGQNLALAYMAGTSATETYGSFKEAGASDRVAGLAMIGNMLALNKLMQNDYFKSAIFRGGYLDEDSVKRPAWEVAKKFKDALTEVGEDVATETGKKKFLTKVTDAFTHSIIPGLQKSEFIRASISEGVEETMEEAVSDISKVFTEALNAIGLNVTKPETQLNFKWSLEDIASRYGMAFVGGTLGGALFQANHAWETRGIPAWIKDAENADLSKFTYLIAQGRGQEIKNYYKKLHDKGLLGDANLSSSKLRTTTGIKGVDEIVAESAEKGQSQNDFVYNALLRQVDYIDNILKDERFAYPESVLQQMALLGITPKDQEESHLLKAQILNLSLINSGFFNEFNALATRTVKVRAELEDLYNKTPKGETESEKEIGAKSFKNNERVKELTEELKSLRKKRDEILDGTLNWYFAGQGLFVLDEATSNGFLSMTKDKYAQLLYNKKINDLTAYEKEKLEESWKNYQNTSGRQNAYRAYDVYLRLSEITKGTLESTMPLLQKLTNDSIHGIKTNLEKYVDAQKEANSVWEEIKKLEIKEKDGSITDEEYDKKEDLIIKLNELNAQVSDLRSNTSALLRGEVEKEPADFNQLNLDLDSLVIAKDYVMTLYKDFATKGQVMRSEDELNAFYRLVRSNPYNAESIKRRWDAYMYQWLEDPELLDPMKASDPEEVTNTNDIPLNGLMTNGPYDSVEPNVYQEHLFNILQELENAIGTNSTLISEKLNEAISYIMSNTNFTEQQALKVIKAVLPKVGNESILDVVNEIEKLRQTVTFSPIYDILREFKAGYSDGTLDIASLLNGEINRLAGYSDLSEYVISSKQVVEELKETGQILNAIRALINGSVSGLNHAVNILRSKQGLDSITELDEHTAKLLLNDIDFILKRINGLLNIASWNNSKKLKAHKESEMKLKPLTLKCLTDPEFAEGFKKLDVDTGEIWRKVNEKYNLDLKDITDENWSAFEEARIEFESELRNAILDKNNGDFSEKLVSCFGDELYKMQTTKIDPETTTITAYDLLWYVADIVSMDSKVFYPRYNNVLSSFKTPDGNSLAPVYGQELAIRRNVSMAINPELYNNVLDKIQKSYPESVHVKRALPNFAVTFGGAGTGKTVAIAGISAAMLSYDDNIEIVYLAPSKKQADNLARNVQQEGTILTSESLKDFFNGDPTFEYELDEKKNKTGIINWHYTTSDKKMWNGDKKRKILIIDEATLINAAQLEGLSEIAVRENGIVWALGDSKQNSSLVKMPDNAMHHTGLEDFTIVKSPELTTALRPSTVGKFDNAIQLDSILSEINRRAIDNNENTLDGYDKLSNDVLDKIVFKYYEDSNTGELFGEKLIESEEQLGVYLAQLGKLAPGKVAYITDKNASVPDGVEKVTLDKVQGGEWEYVIIDKKWNTNSKYDTLRDLYTLTQRSTKGTIIMNNGIKSVLPVSSKSDVSAAEPMTLDPKDLNEFVQWKKDSLGGYVMDMDFINTVNAIFDNMTNNEDKGDDGDPDPDPTPDPDPNPQEPDDQDSTGDPDEGGEPGNPTPNVKPDSTPEPKPKKTPQQTAPAVNKPNTPKQTIDPVNKVETDELAYFDMVFGDKYWESHANDVEYLKQLGFKDGDIKNITLLLSSAIKVEGTNLKRKINLGGLTKVPLANSKLVKFIDSCDILLNIVPNAGDSLIIATFTNNIGTEFKIPICVLPKVTRSGRYVGEFKLKSKPTKIRGEWKSIYDVQKAHPWLKVFNTWQVVSYKDFETISKRDDLNDATKGYLEGNNGKVFTLATDNLYLARKKDSTSIYSLTDYYDGTKYTHGDYENLVNFGLMQTATLSEVIQYSLLWANKIGTISDDAMPPITIDGDTDAWLMDMVGLDVLPDEKLSNRRFQILNSNNCARLLTKLMNLAMAGDKQLASIIGWSFVKSFQHKDVAKNNGNSKVIYKNGLRLRGKNGNYYWMEYDYDSSSYNIYEYSNETSRIEKEAIASFAVKQERGKFPFKQLSEFIGNITWMDVATRTFDENGTQLGNPYAQCVSNQISLFFQSIKKESAYEILDKKLLEDGYFINGRIYTNVAGASGNDPIMPNGLARRFVGPKQDYMTDASEWKPSIYLVDLGSKDVDDSATNARLEFADKLEQISELVSSIIDISDLLSTTSAVQSDYDSKLEEIVEKINGRLKNSANSWEYKKLVLNGYNYTLETESDLNGWLQEKAGVQGEIIIDFNALENFKFGVFSVSLSNFYIKQDGDQWVVKPMKSYASFKPMIEFWNQNFAELVRLIPTFEKYLSEIYGTSTRASRDVAITLDRLSGGNIDTLKMLLENYLMERINNEEC